MQKFIFGHTSFETAYRVENYPYGRLRTSMFYWIESEPKKGERFCSRTINPKNGRLNAPKKSTYSNIGVMYLDENEYVQFTGVSIYTQREKLEEFIAKVGEENLNENQKLMLRQLRGEKIQRPLIKGMDFKVKYEKSRASENKEEVEYSEARITFDRPDGVKLIEIFKAIKSLDQAKLAKVWAGWTSTRSGEKIEGFIRICTRGGAQLTMVHQNDYKEFLASDHVTAETE